MPDGYTYFWYHRAKEHSNNIALTLHNLLGEAQDIVACIKADPEGAEAHKIDEKTAIALHDQLLSLSNNYHIMGKM